MSNDDRAPPHYADPIVLRMRFEKRADAPSTAPVVPPTATMSPDAAIVAALRWVGDAVRGSQRPRMDRGSS